MTDVKALLGELRASDAKFDEAQAVVDLVRAAGDMLERMRERNDWSQAELAARLGVTTARVSQLESGTLRNAPSLKMMARVAHACGESVKLAASGESVADAHPAAKAAIDLTDVMRELAALRGEVRGLRSALSEREPVAEMVEPEPEMKHLGWSYEGEIETVRPVEPAPLGYGIKTGSLEPRPLRTKRWILPGMPKAEKAEE